MAAEAPLGAARPAAANDARRADMPRSRRVTARAQLPATPAPGFRVYPVTDVLPTRRRKTFQVAFTTFTTFT